jgi:predicted nucleic acid-binding protein
VTVFLLDSTVVIDRLRDVAGMREHLRRALLGGHHLATSAVTVAEVVRGLHPGEERATEHVLRRLRFLATTREAGLRAGTYQRELARRGVTLHLADALVAGTARAHGAVLVTDNLRDFPMRDLRVIRPEAL